MWEVVVEWGRGLRGVPLHALVPTALTGVCVLSAGENGPTFVGHAGGLKGILQL